jgi:arabinofuranosyltransferase
MISPGRPARIGRGLLLLGILAFSWLFVRNAWVSDDAKITFRSVEQLHAGHGPRWNPHERVQAFTHPLWFLLLAAARGVSADSFLNAVALSWALGLAALLVSWRLFRDPRRWLLAWALLLSSRAFVDFSSSGLENPLVFALLTGLLVLLADRREGFRESGAPVTAEVLPATAAISLLLLCRHDLALLAGPPFLAFLAPRVRAAPRRAVAAVAIGALPFVAWTLFSIVYYGFPFPNTAYAKLANGIPDSELWRQGIAYVVNLARWDPLTLVVVVAATVIALREPPPGVWWGLGMLAYLGYIVRIGGDFMAGRFFTPVLLVAAFTLAARFPLARFGGVLAAGLLLYALALPGAPWKVGRSYRAAYDQNVPAEAGITDEKGYYFKESSLGGHLAGWDRPGPPLADPVTLAGAVGATGLQAGVDRIVVDENALCDPLLARLPSERPWRIGHFRRAVPQGYLESLRAGGNRIVNPYVRGLYADVRRVTQGPLWDAGRWRAIVRLNLRPPRLPCADPPCRELVLYVMPASTYIPRFWRQAGALDRVRADGPVVSVEGRVPFGDLAAGQKLHVAVPVAAQASRVMPGSGPGTFVLELRFANPVEAGSAARELCIAVESADSPGKLLASDRPACRRLLGPVSQGSR